MSVADHAPPTIDPIVESLLAVDLKTGQPNKAFISLLQQLRDYNVGGARIIPCDAGGTANAIILTPNNPVSPQLSQDGYSDYDGFAFTASANSTSAVTVTVVPPSGSLATLKLYKDHGATQANNGDLGAGLFYIARYVSSADSGNGGLVIT